jgi:soluble lytic murein transglycosylase-like protein
VKPGRASPLLRLGVILHGNKIWISEFASIVLIAGLLLSFFTLTFTILLNEARIRGNDGRVLALQADKQAGERQLADLGSKERIIDAMRAVLGDRYSAQTYWQLSGLVLRNSTTYGYDPLLLLAVIDVESRFVPHAGGKYRSGDSSGAFGLMQIKPETARDIGKSLGLSIGGESDLLRPDVNVVIGAAYLMQLIARFRSFKLGLLAYNQGPGAIHEQLAAQQPLSISYYHKVLRKYYRFKAITDSLAEKVEK